MPDGIAALTAPPVRMVSISLAQNGEVVTAVGFLAAATLLLGSLAAGVVCSLKGKWFCRNLVPYHSHSQGFQRSRPVGSLGLTLGGRVIATTRTSRPSREHVGTHGRHGA
jgi:hypothetical protein